MQSCGQHTTVHHCVRYDDGINEVCIYQFHVLWRSTNNDSIYLNGSIVDCIPRL